MQSMNAGRESNLGLLDHLAKSLPSLPCHRRTFNINLNKKEIICLGSLAEANLNWKFRFAEDEKNCIWDGEVLIKCEFSIYFGSSGFSWSSQPHDGCFLAKKWERRRKLLLLSYAAKNDKNFKSVAVASDINKDSLVTDCGEIYNSSIDVII